MELLQQKLNIGKDDRLDMGPRIVWSPLSSQLLVNWNGSSSGKSHAASVNNQMWDNLQMGAGRFKIRCHGSVPVSSVWGRPYLVVCSEESPDCNN